MGKEKTEDPSMRKVRRAYKHSGLTQQQIGEKMGYAPTTARQAVSQFLKSGDPQIGMLRRFARAVGVKLESLI
jgi:transcriptional regulator with XRE-family HTH domain